MPTETAWHRGWGDPANPNFPDRMVVITVDNVKFRVHKAVAPILEHFLERMCKENKYSLDETKDDWSYLFRPVRGYEDEYRRTKQVNYLSNHSWGLAIDVNATRNPMTSNLNTDMPVAWIRNNAQKYLIRWGGDYTGRKDAMHFEFVGTPEDAARIRTRITKEISMERTVAKLDAEDLQNIKEIVNKEVATAYHLLHGKPGADTDPSHVSLNDLNVKLDRILSK